jgi:DNA polymerase-3 subunit alpha
MPRSEFVHLHLHTQYSLLDGACRIPELLSLASHYKMDSLAITDHGAMFGAIEFYQEALKCGIKPIIGCEAYIAPKSRFEKTSGGIDEASYHLILLARDETGYHNLMKLVSTAYIEGFYYRPRIDKECLAQYSKGLIGLSACLKGEIPSLIQEKRFNDALKEADNYLNIFGKGNFYLEVQGNSIPEQRIVNEGLLRISKELSLPLVATNDVHYLKKEYAASHEALLCIQTQTTLDDPNRLRLQTDEFYFLSPEEMKQLFKDLPEAINNTLEIAQRCNLELDFSQTHLPKYDPPNGQDKEAYLRDLCVQGLKKRFPQEAEEVQQRLEYELKMIKNMGFISYFLIVWDFIHYAKNKNIPVGPGRGSAAGSLVSYLLGITDINPLRYGLLFERFLNPDRLGLPDIDIDFCYERRQEVIDYVTQKYGRQNVAQIITFGTMQARAVVRDVGRVMGMAYADVDRIAKMIPPDPNITLKDALVSESELNDLYKNDPQVTRLIDTALQLEGLNRHASVHAAGVVISDKPLDNYMPLFKTSDDQITTGYSMGILEKIGLLKVDFLGLRTLTVIDETVKLARRTRAQKIDIENIALDDLEAYKLLVSAQTIGVFQVESSGMRDLLRKLEPGHFEDLIALLALYRPGPIGSGMLDDFMKRKRNQTPIRYEHPSLEPILKETYGIMVYQEQIMQIASSLAGFTLAQADLLRKAMGKKIPEVMEKQRNIFISGCVNNGIRQTTASKIFDLIEYFSGYGFNKCIVGSTKIIAAENGEPVTVEELFKNRTLAQTTFSCAENGKIVKTKIKDVVFNGKRPVYKLKTNLGRKITATSNHPFLTFKGWKNLEDLHIGERIALPRIIPLKTNNQWEPHKIIVLAGIISEGNTCHPSGIYFYNDSRVMVEDFVVNLQKFDNTVPKIFERRGRFEVYEGTGKDARFFKGQIPWNKDATLKTETKRSGVRIWVEELGLSYKKAAEKFIPREIFCLDNSQIALFLGRLWSGDGFIFGKNNTIPFYASSSSKLCQQIQELLLRLNITSRLNCKTFNYSYKGNKKKVPGFTVYLFGRDSIIRFADFICPFVIDKERQINQLREYYNKVTPEAESKDTLPPDIKEVVREEKDKLGLSWRELEIKSGVCMKEFYGAAHPRKRGFRRQTILRLAHFLESERLLRQAASDILWDRVVSVEYAGKADTYDIEIEGIHNFIANGIIVHNSHSAAYAMISYRTAYLKANFPVEFMTALLTSERDNTDKIVEYVNEAQRMNLEVLPPNINESEILFKVVDEKTIRFGLLAVKNVGHGAAESILRARQENGRFLSLQDLCKKVDLRLVNRKVLESLIKCGALDDFKHPRAQMVAGLDSILEQSSKIQRDQAKGQLSFFDQAFKESGFRAAVSELPQVHEWPEPQILAFEKEMLGFYVSGHPLARYAGTLKRFSSTPIPELSRRQDEEEIKLVGMISKIKQTVTRAKQERMDILKLEDLEGSVEALVFPQAYQKVYRYILPSTVVLVRGRLNLKEDAPKIVVNDLFPVDEIYKMISSININLSGIRENLFTSLKEVLAENKGDTPIYMHLDTPTRSRIHLVVGEGLFVEPSEKLIQDIETLLGEDRLSLIIK